MKKYIISPKTTKIMMQKLLSFNFEGKENYLISGYLLTKVETSK